MHPQEIHRRRFKFFPWQGLYSPTRLQGNVEVIYGSGNLSRMQSVPPVHYLGGKLCQLQDSRERILPVLPSPIARPRLLGGSPQEGQVRLREPGACVPQPASDTTRTIHSNSDYQQESEIASKPPTGNSPASLQALSEAGFAIVHEVPGHCGGDLWFGQQRSDAVSANSPLPRAKGSAASRFQGKNPTSSSIADCPPETAGRITSRRTSEASRARRVCAAACQRYHPHYPFEFRFPARIRNCEQATFPEATMTAQNWPDSFEQVVMPHLHAAYNLARWLTRNEPDAQDAVQEAYLRSFRHFPDFRGGDARAWLLKIVRNTCYSWLRINRPLQDATEFDENLFAPDVRPLNPEEVVLQNNSRTVVREALQKLPPNLREVLILRELEGMSYREIGAITGMPAGTVMSSLSRARGRLRQVLTASSNGDTAPSSRRTAVVNA